MDGYPDSVCLSCITQLECFESFKKSCLASQDKFKKEIDPDRPDITTIQGRCTFV